MSYFKIINDLPIIDNLYQEFVDMLDNQTIWWYRDTVDQICINTVPEEPDNFHLGRGSLTWDWDNSTYDENNQIVLNKREKQLREEDFTVLCNQFKNTSFEKIYVALEKKYVLGRVRIMNLLPKTCLTWHKDSTTRVHYPMLTHEGCFMVIQDEVKHLPVNTWWHTDTSVKHTVFNGSKKNRYHIVAAIIDKK